MGKEEDRESRQEWCACDPVNRAARGPENPIRGLMTG